jgi:polyribonucleotide nucleotidyltransferase
LKRTRSDESAQQGIRTARDRRAARRASARHQSFGATIDSTRATNPSELSRSCSGHNQRNVGRQVAPARERLDTRQLTDLQLFQSEANVVDRSSHACRVSRGRTACISAPSAAVCKASKSSTVLALDNSTSSALRYRYLSRTLAPAQTQVRAPYELCVHGVCGYWVQAGFRPSSAKAFA